MNNNLIDDKNNIQNHLNEKGINVSNFTKNKHEDSTFQLSLFNG